MNAREILRILKKNGFYEVGQKGSHLKLKKDDKITILPVHGKKDLKIGTIKSIEKNTGVKLI